MEDKYVGYIYCITNKVTEKRYVGQTSTTVQQRYKEHTRCALSGANTTSILYKSMRKHGLNSFYVETLEKLTADSKEHLKSLLNEREMFHIADKDTYKPNGYNMTEGGYAFADHVTVGVFDVDQSGVVVAHYTSMREAQQATGVDEDSVCHACRSNSHFGGGHFWYLDDCGFNVGQNIGPQSRGKNNWPGHKTRPGIPVNRHTKDGVYIDTFCSATIAAKELNISHAHISKCCHGIRKTAGGYRWSFANQN